MAGNEGQNPRRSETIQTRQRSGKERGKTAQDPEMLSSLGAEVVVPLFYFISFFVLIGSVVHEYAHFELFINFPTKCLDFVVFARITQTNDSKAYLEAQLLIDLARSKVYFLNLNYLADLCPHVQLQISTRLLDHMLML